MKPGVAKSSTYSGTDNPVDHQVIETVDHERWENLSSRILKLCDVGQPFLIRCRRLEVPVDQFLWRRADFA